MSWYWLWLLWPIIGWIRLYLYYREEKRVAGRQRMTLEISDFSVFVWAAIWPFFER